MLGEEAVGERVGRAGVVDGGSSWLGDGESTEGVNGELGESTLESSESFLSCDDAMFDG